MITFLGCLGLLVAAYFTYGRYLERLCGVDAARPVPSATSFDGVDYIPMPMWRTFLIQLLNIAGLGPIFGAVLGAAYGPVAFLWITFGGIFMGAAHDFIAGIVSLRSNGASLPETVGTYLGPGIKQLMRIFSVGLMVLVGAVFLSQPASLIANRIEAPALSGIAFGSFSWLLLIILGVILIYYIVATLLPVDKIIGRIYPVFGCALLFMALGILAVLLFSGKYTIPEFTSLENCIADPERFPILPMLFTTIACGAISGFHATQSPLMARCLRSERQARPVFYGAMISESIIALIWAAIAMAFWNGASGLNAAIAEYGGRSAGRTGDLRGCGLRHHLGRYGVPFGTADRGRFHGARTAQPAQANLYQHPALRCGAGHYFLPAVRGHVELFRMDEPDTGDGHAVDDYGLPEQTGPQPLGGAPAGAGHDLRLHVLCLYIAAYVRHARPGSGLPAGRRADTRYTDNHDF